MKKRIVLLKILFVFLINVNLLKANSNYKIESLDKIQIILFQSYEIHLIDTLNNNGCFSINDVGTKNNKIQFCLKGKTVLQAGNEILHEIEKYFRITEQGFHLVIHPKKSDYLKKIEVSGFEIRNNLIPQRFINEEYRLNDSSFKKGFVYREYNLQFNSNNELVEESKTKLKLISQFLIKNDSLKIEIGVYFDERIEKVLSNRYSQEKAEIIKKYLIVNGVDKERLIAKGFEDKNPLIKYASSEKQHQKNRRVEFQIIEIKNKF